MPNIIVVFSSARAAEYRVAGIPAAARAAQAIAALKESGDVAGCAIVAGPDWSPGDAVLAECLRLAPGLRPAFTDPGTNGEDVVVSGERLVAAVARHGGGPHRDVVLPALVDALLGAATPTRPGDGEAAIADLRRAGRRILARTGKAGDGIVSRYVNRPISRAISGVLLKVPGLTPSHATLCTGMLGAAMTLALVLGGGIGLVVGAILFQAASIFDGVDGEMARATGRTSKVGATLDSVIDAFTNLGFLIGVTANVALAGDVSGAFAGAVALVALAAGLLMMSTRARAGGEPVNFDFVKGYLRRGGRASVPTEWLIHLTMRDFFAAASAVLILAGLTHALLVGFAAGALGWLAVTATILSVAGRRPDAAFRGARPDAAPRLEMSECR